jgi:hypothetical protein
MKKDILKKLVNLVVEEMESNLPVSESSFDSGGFVDDELKKLFSSNKPTITSDEVDSCGLKHIKNPDDALQRVNGLASDYAAQYGYVEDPKTGNFVKSVKEAEQPLNEVGVDKVLFTVFLPGKVNGELLNKKMPNVDFLQGETRDLESIISKYPSLGVDGISDEVYTVLETIRVAKENGELRTGKNKVFFFVDEDNKLSATTNEIVAKESNKEATAKKSTAADDDEPKSVAVPDKWSDDDEDDSWAAEKELGYDFDKERAYRGSGDLWESLPPWTQRKLREALKNNIKKMLNENSNICADCQGSGEGQYDGSKCNKCDGTGLKNYKKKLTKHTDPDYDWDGEREERMGVYQ